MRKIEADGLILALSCIVSFGTIYLVALYFGRVPVVVISILLAAAFIWLSWFRSEAPMQIPSGQPEWVAKFYWPEITANGTSNVFWNPDETERRADLQDIHKDLIEIRHLSSMLNIDAIIAQTVLSRHE